MSVSRRLYVLVVDDDPEFLTMMGRLLESRGHVAATAPSAIGLVERIAGVPGIRPDVVVLDCGLPGLPGVLALQHLAADPRTRDVPVVLTSASAHNLVGVPRSTHPLWRSHLKDGRVNAITAAIEAAAALSMEHPEHATHPHEVAAPRNDGRAPVLLLAEDDVDIREQATIWLHDAGFDVRVAEHGGDAIAQLVEGLRPDAIVLDLNMPVVSGWAVYDWLRQSPCADVPVIVWTASTAVTGTVGQSADRVVHKGRDPQALLNTIRASTSWTRGVAGGGPGG